MAAATRVKMFSSEPHFDTNVFVAARQLSVAQTVFLAG